MFDFLDQYGNTGHFFFIKGDKLTKVSKVVPDQPGVYYIIRILRGMKDIVYIGKSGTIKQNGLFGNQKLRSRINNKQDGINRQQYYDQKLREENIERIEIHWYVTFDDNIKDLPGYVEGLLIQEYFEQYGQLPEWNKEY